MQLEMVDAQGQASALLVMYPTVEPVVEAAIGPFRLELAENAPLAPGWHPLVLISHGRGGTHLGYRDLASHLACQGHVVAMPEHPGDNRRDASLSDDDANLAMRPRHLSRVIDHLLDIQPFAAAIDPDRIAVVGHSMGGYTALALAGGRPRTPAGEAVLVDSDPRLTGIVLLAPATPWFMAPGSLGEVKVPVLMLTAERDPHTPAFHGKIVQRELPAAAALRHRVVENAGHFAFMSPFPSSMRSPGFLPGNDPEGFDREAFQQTLGPQVSDFLTEVFQRRLSG